MKNIIIAGVLLLSGIELTAGQQYNIIIDKPSQSWKEATPMGNGRIGAMIEGGIANEVIHINEDTLWSGEPLPHLDGTRHRNILPKVRDLIFKGKQTEATALGNRTMLGRYNQAYMPFGQLKIKDLNSNASKAVDYRRNLNLNRAVTNISYKIGDVTYTRTIFISFPDQAMIVRLKASKKGALNFELSLDSLMEHTSSVDKDGLLVMNGRAPIHVDPHYHGRRISYDKSAKKLGMRFSSAVKASTVDGTVATSGNALKVSNATECVIRFSARTSFNGFDKSPSQNGKDASKLAKDDLRVIQSKSLKALYSRHLADYTPIFDRVELELGNTTKNELPVSQRVGKDFKPGADPDLDELFYQFNRYLLIASSRKGSQAANLQGIWTHKMIPSWSANFTINCNAQFNYIGSGAAGLSELNEPFLRMIEEASVDGVKVAKDWYGTNGWVLHHNLDLWRAAVPVAGNVLSATFPTGGTWTVVELYDNWKFDPKPAMLARINKLQKGNVIFWLENLQKHPVSGKFISVPDVYFENFGNKKSGERFILSAGPVSSTILIKQIFLDYIESSQKLKLDNHKLISRIKSMVKQMPTIKINSDGELRQWHGDFDGNWMNYDKTQLLVMVGAIYSKQIQPKLTPKLAKALLQMLNTRKSGYTNYNNTQENGQGSWRAAFPATTYARLGKGDLFKKVLNGTYTTWTNPNLTTGFIQSEWMFDGNLGLMGAMQEALIQSQTNKIVLLPALPKEWAKQGSVKGMKARGGFKLDFAWKNGKIISYKVYGRKPGTKVKLVVNGQTKNVVVK